MGACQKKAPKSDSNYETRHAITPTRLARRRSTRWPLTAAHVIIMMFASNSGKGCASLIKHGSYVGELRSRHEEVAARQSVDRRQRICYLLTYQTEQ